MWVSDTLIMYVQSIRNVARSLWKVSAQLSARFIHDVLSWKSSFKSFRKFSVHFTNMFKVSGRLTSSSSLCREKKERLRNTSIGMYVTKFKKRCDFFIKWISKSSWNAVIEPDDETWNLVPESSKNFSANFSNIWKTHWSWIFASEKYFDCKTCYDDFKPCFEKFNQEK